MSIFNIARAGDSARSTLPADPPRSGGLPDRSSRRSARPAESESRRGRRCTTSRLRSIGPSTAVTWPIARPVPVVAPRTRRGRAGKTSRPAAARPTPMAREPRAPASASASSIVSTPSNPTIGRPLMEPHRRESATLATAAPAIRPAARCPAEAILREVGLGVHDDLPAIAVRARDAPDQEEIGPCASGRA